MCIDTSINPYPRRSKMLKRFLNFIKDLFRLNPIERPPMPIIVDGTQQTASIEVVRFNLANTIKFHNEEYRPPLTINALVHGGTLKQRDFMRNALNILRHIVVSDMFQNAALDHGPFFDTEDNPLIIYTKFISGKDLYDKFADNEMDVDVTLYYNRWTKTLGYTYPNTRKTHINMAKINIEEFEMMATVVGNIVHEYMHNLGYGHTKFWTSDRDTSVPYAYGYMARDLALEFLGSGRDIAKFEEIYQNDSTN